MSSTKTNQTPTDSLTAPTNRTAVDFSGRIGSLYDASRDCILGQLNVKNEEKLNQLRKNVQCDIIHSNNDQTRNFLKLFGINEQLRLSILLNLAPDQGIASLIDYSYATKGYARLLRYSYVKRIQQLPDILEDARVFIRSFTSKTEATHIITSIDWGIDFIVIFELPFDTKVVKKIDRALQTIRTLLLNDDKISTLTPKEEKLFESIIHTKVYSNISGLCAMKTLRDVCQYIEQNKYSTVYHPISYTLRPIKWLHPYYTGQSITYISLSRNLNDSIEHYVLQLTDDIRNLKRTIYENIPKLLSGHLNDQLLDLQKKWSNTNSKCMSEIQHLSKLVVNIRRGKVFVPTIEQALKKNEQILIKNNIVELTQSVYDLQEKGKLIDTLMEQKFQYRNVTDYGVDRIDDEKAIERKLIMDNQRDRILCSNDALNKIKSEQLKDLRQDMVEEFKNNPHLRLIYADFSYCSFKLQNITKLPSNRYKNEDSKLNQKEETSSREQQSTLPPPTETRTSAASSTKSQTFSLSFTEKQTLIPDMINAQTTGPFFAHIYTDTLSQAVSQTSPPTLIEKQTDVPAPAIAQTPVPSLDNEIINILLLGETGVGKSTFINALANYLKFNTLRDAQIGQPVVLIPVSFLITVGDNFDEYTVKFGDLKGTKNENFDRPGESVTQRCKSYVFNLDHTDEKKLRIIDTPGFGDTRGVDQDDSNMQHILKYIQDLKYLNAACFLLKPNESRLNIFFRSCLTQLFSLLGRNIGSRIIFCFTNSRSTFYTPGNTAPLLKNMLASLPTNDIAFTKDNTFCFDSESFRYLVALRNKIPFSDVERQEYEKSWSTSVTQANRLIDYIRTNLTAYPVLNKR